MPTRRRFASASTLLGVVVCLVLAVTTTPAARQATPDIAVVVHPDVPVDNLTVAELRRLLLGDREFWTAGQRVTLFIRAPIARERDAAVKDVCQMTEAQFRQHWIAKVFRADAVTGPKIVYSSQMAVEQVSRTPGAMAFVDAPLAGKGVKVVKIEGKSPGQAGYRLK